MKKIILITFAIAISMITVAQTSYQKPNGDRYLLPNTYGLVFDIDSLEQIAYQEGKYYSVVEVYITGNTNGYNIYDFAQPCYSDSLLTIVGVSALFMTCDYKEMNAYLCIADTNFEIYRATKIPSTDNVGSTYTEVFFDDPINVKGKFMVIWDNPKPDGYGEYNYNFSFENIRDVDVKLGTVGVRYIEDYIPYYRKINMNSQSIVSNFIWQPDSFVTLTKQNNFTLFLFPIFGELDTTLECIGSRQKEVGIRDVSMVDKYTNIFPNPAIDEVNVQSSFKIKCIEIYNILGEQVLSKEVNAYNTKINTASLSKGNYILKVKTNSGTTNKKLIVE